MKSRLSRRGVTWTRAFQCSRLNLTRALPAQQLYRCTRRRVRPATSKFRRKFGRTFGAAACRAGWKLGEKLPHVRPIVKTLSTSRLPRCAGQVTLTGPDFVHGCHVPRTDQCIIFRVSRKRGYLQDDRNSAAGNFIIYSIFPREIERLGLPATGDASGDDVFVSAVVTLV